ncbi:MAG: hypothetical protein N2749_06165 [Clostridia bacterium]|nr:hypothetical protein [Clostridia bacterium]
MNAEELVNFIIILINIIIVNLILNCIFYLYKLKFNKLSTITKNKSLNVNLLQRVRMLMIELKNIKTIKDNKNIKLILILIVSIILSITVFSISYYILKIKSTSVILSIFFSIIPYLLTKYLIYLKRNNILRKFPIYIINLKNFTEVNNNIVTAIKNVDADESFKLYIDIFNISVEKGISVYDSFERLKNNINIKKIGEFISVLQFCYIYGGDYNRVLDKYSKILIHTINHKETERQQIFSSKAAILLLTAINIYIFYIFIFNNIDYYNIFTKTSVGVILLNINLISYILIFFILIKINKMEE